MAASDKVILGYVGGYSRSGSTLLDRMLGQVSGGASTGELVYLTLNSLGNDRLCGCGRHFSECSFWLAVGERAFGGWQSDEARELASLHPRIVRHRKMLLIAAPVLGPRFRRSLRRYTELLARVYTAVAQVKGTNLVIDSSVDPAYAYVLRHLPGVELRTVHLVRDSRGTAFSWTKRQLMKGSPHQAVEKGTYPPLVTALRWDVYHLLFALLRLLGVAQILVRYEDMTNHPQDTVERVLDHLGHPVNGSAGRHFVDPATIVLEAQHTALGNDMRFRTGAVTLRSDDAWKTSLPRRQRLIVSLMTLPMLTAYGYLVGLGERVS